MNGATLSPAILLAWLQEASSLKQTVISFISPRLARMMRASRSDNMHIVLGRFLEKVPWHLRNGRWSPLAHIYLVWFFFFLVISGFYAEDSFLHYRAAPTPNYLAAYRAIAAIYCSGITWYIWHRVGPGPFVTYTVSSQHTRHFN